MKINNCIIKSLIAVTIITFIFIILTSYFVWDKSQYKKELVTVQNELTLIKEELIITQENYQIEIEKSIGLSEELDKMTNDFSSISEELKEANITIETLKNEEYELVYIGGFKITYYCDERYHHICGGNGVTKSGKPTEVGVTAAADWSVLPKGSKVYIEGVGFREIQDVGGGVHGNHIDVLVESHNEALSLGINIKGVWVLTKKDS